MLATSCFQIPLLQLSRSLSALWLYICNPCFDIDIECIVHPHVARAMKFGALGTVIAQETVHVLDTQGEYQSLHAFNVCHVVHTSQQETRATLVTAHSLGDSNKKKG